MNDNQITAIIVALISTRYLVPGKDNEKTAKEIVDIYKILKEKTYSDDDDNYGPDIPFMNPANFTPGV